MPPVLPSPRSRAPATRARPSCRRRRNGTAPRTASLAATRTGRPRGGPDTDLGPDHGLACGVDGYEPAGTAGFDCTGLTLYAVYQVTGLRLSHDGTQATSAPGQTIMSQSALEPGDIVYFDGTLDNFVHAGVYAGVVNGSPSFWSAVTEYVGVKLMTMADEEKANAFVGAVRFWH